jgi:hypothetical protein
VSTIDLERVLIWYRREVHQHRIIKYIKRYPSVVVILYLNYYERAVPEDPADEKAITNKGSFNIGGGCGQMR